MSEVTSAATAPVVPAATTATTVDTTAAPQLGFSHFISQTDSVGQGLFIILVLMSLVGLTIAARRFARILTP